MPKPKIAEEWAAQCEGRTDEVGGDLLLCPTCARAYAYQQVEAWKEQAIRACLNVTPRLRETAIGRQQRIAAALRALPVEPA